MSPKALRRWASPYQECSDRPQLRANYKCDSCHPNQGTFHICKQRFKFLSSSNVVSLDLPRFGGQLRSWDQATLSEITVSFLSVLPACWWHSFVRPVPAQNSKTPRKHRVFGCPCSKLQKVEKAWSFRRRSHTRVAKKLIRPTHHHAASR